MDSLYDAPRRSSILSVPDRPCLIDGISGSAKDYMTVAPVVPEVSMICSNNTTENPTTAYNTWKMQQNQNRNCENNMIFNKENIYGRSCNHNYNVQQQQNTSQMLKKQVRFETPTIQQRPSLTYEPLINKDKIFQPHNFNNQCIRPRLKNDKILSTAPNNYGGNFEQIYMANIPKRHLDLSIVDMGNPQTISGAKEKKIDKINSAPKEQCQPSTRNDFSQTELRKRLEEEDLPKTYKEFRAEPNKHFNLSQEECVTDILNYQRPHKQIATNLTKQQDYNNCRGIEPLTNKPNYCEAVDISSRRRDEYDCYSTNKRKDLEEFNSKPQPNNSDEPTIKDLMKIIQQQNEQIILLQKHVTNLTNHKIRQEQICSAAPPLAPVVTNNLNEMYVTSTKLNEAYKNPLINDAPNKNPLSKFSIDLMATSFEVSFRPHQQNIMCNRKHKEFIQTEPKIQEITESSGDEYNLRNEYFNNTKNPNETSLHLHESLNVRDNCPSPEPSININMNQYDSSNDDDEDCDEISSSDIGVTFYNNLMEQVNNMLRETQVEPKYPIDKTKPTMSNKIIDQTHTNTVKEATLKHLRSIGVNLPSNEDSSDFAKAKCAAANKNYNPKEVSFAVKQLLMKYLPDEQLAKIAYNQKQNLPTNAYNKAEKIDLLSKKPDFSFASIEYMKKYNLIAEKGANNSKKPPIEAKIIGKPTGGEVSKILDIAALKLQPKLL